jgi:hypothetical protein
MSDIDHEWSDEIVCPYCGHERSDSWECGTSGEGDWDDECDECGKPFRTSRNVTITYTTRKKPSA